MNQNKLMYLVEAQLKFSAYLKNYKKLMSHSYSCNNLVKNNSFDVKDDAAIYKETNVQLELPLASGEKINESEENSFVDVTRAPSTIIFSENLRSYKNQKKSTKESMQVNVINVKINAKKKIIKGQHNANVQVIQKGNFFEILQQRPRLTNKYKIRD